MATGRRGVTVTVTAKSLGGATSAAAQTHGVRGGRVDDVDVGRAHGRNTPAAGPPGISRCPASRGSAARGLRTGTRTRRVSRRCAGGSTCDVDAVGRRDPHVDVLVRSTSLSPRAGSRPGRGQHGRAFDRSLLAHAPDKRWAMPDLPSPRLRSHGCGRLRRACETLATDDQRARKPNRPLSSLRPGRSGRLPPLAWSQRAKASNWVQKPGTR